MRPLTQLISISRSCTGKDNSVWCYTDLQPSPSLYCKCISSALKCCRLQCENRVRDSNTVWSIVARTSCNSSEVVSLIDQRPLHHIQWFQNSLSCPTSNESTAYIASAILLANQIKQHSTSLYHYHHQ